MSEAIFPAPDLALFLGPDDRALFIGHCAPPQRSPYVCAAVYVVVHRRHGAWTHVYRVLQEANPTRLLVHLEKVVEGEHVAQARAWALATLIPGGRDRWGRLQQRDLDMAQSA